jgi:hypothetical protein
LVPETSGSQIPFSVLWCPLSDRESGADWSVLDSFRKLTGRSSGQP